MTLTVELSTEILTSKEYASDIAAQISMERALTSDEIAPGKLSIYESDETTHYSVVDDEGNMVGNTLCFPLVQVVIEGTGILMNNNMGNFTLAPIFPMLLA